ncbi:MAG: IS3 family transposase [Bacteroidia bacterium]|nr:IS3 family transposase [Bacteroidia bacterium]
MQYQTIEEMKNNFPNIEFAKLCSWFGITRQAYYQNSWTAIETTIEEELMLQQVKQIRQSHPRLGTRKLYDKLQPFILDNSIKMGRDALFNLLSTNRLLIRKRKRRIQTTNSYHWLRKYPNLIKNFVPEAPNHLWVSDLTYWKINTQEHLYISFITDAYSHKIVGYHVAETLEAIESIQALQMALSAFERTESLLQLTHHSDRGIQYCSKEYVKLLQDKNIQISMTENGDPLENAIAERVNGIIKEEYLDAYQVNNIKEAKELLDSVIQLYNNDRPHLSISNLTPSQVHHSLNQLKTRKYYQKKQTAVNVLQD